MLPTSTILCDEPRKVLISRLTEAIEAKTNPYGTEHAARTIATGWEGADAALGGGLAAGAIHEWFGEGDGEERGRGWLPSLGVLSHMARRAMEEQPGSRIVWIGQRCWAYPRSLVMGPDRALLRRSVFIDAACVDERVWAIDLALRCSAVAAVVADGSGLKMPATRRLQLAAGNGHAIGLFARPHWERNELSAARTRWLISAAPSETNEPRWNVELLRCKGVQPAREEARWTVRRDHETGDVGVVAAAGERSGPAQRPAALRTA